MTAEVAILNTHGVALAADSAVTISVGGEKKVYNTANKLFTLSKYHPVGIMIYNNATYMGIDWEIIIKGFRKTLKTTKCETLFEYAEKFIKYLEEFTPITEDQQKDILISICQSVISFIRDSFLTTLENIKNTTGEVTLDKLSEVLDTIIINIQEHQRNIDENKYNIIDKNFIDKYKNEIFEKIDLPFEKINISIKQKEGILEIIRSKIIITKYLSNFTGIVISGYGDKEIYPSIYKCEIFGKIGESFILIEEDKESISYNRTALLRPFAQSDMVYTFMNGIDHEFQDAIEGEVNNLMLAISGVIGNSYENQFKEIKNVFIDRLKQFKRKSYIEPVMEIVESLQKTDLAEMAETLVNLTAFKRHISKNRETVGGPTDVAVITKGDGFVWIKRKHYFDIKLNQSFTQNYFMEDENE